MSEKDFKENFEKAKRAAIKLGMSEQEAEDCAQEYCLAMLTGRQPVLKWAIIDSSRRRFGRKGSERYRALQSYTEINEPIFENGDATFESTYRGHLEPDVAGRIEPHERVDELIEFFGNTIGLKGGIIEWIKRTLRLSLETRKLETLIQDEEL